jgi:5-bromo-4-chloroindolyl phosphate hydrolysis protein
MRKSILNVLLSVMLWIVVCSLPYFAASKNIIIQKTQGLTLTDYYKQDLEGQCRGIKYFDKMVNENSSLSIYEKFNKEYRLTLDYIKRDSEYLGLDNYKCPE